MASHKVNELVAGYRKNLIREYDQAQIQAQLLSEAAKLSDEDFADYVALTLQIDAAADDVLDYINERGLAPSTCRSYFRAAVAKAGLDHSDKVRS